MIANCLPGSENAAVNPDEANDRGQIAEDGEILQHGNPVSQQDLRVWANSKCEYS